MADKPANKWQKIAQDAESKDSLAEKAMAQDIEEALLELADEDKLTWLKGQLLDSQEAAQKEADRMVRTMAEMENLRRRTDRDVENARKYAVEKLLKALLPVIDSMDRGLQAMTAEEPAVVAAKEGLNMTREMTLTVLQQHGIKLIAPEKGDAFDPALHEAVSMQPEEGVPANAVVNVLQPGYELNGRVVRAAMVVVST